MKYNLSVKGVYETPGASQKEGIMFTGITRAVALVLWAASAVCAGIITLENALPSVPPYLQPPGLSILTGAAPVFGSGGGVVGADAFTTPVSATLYQISVVVNYEDFPSFGVAGRFPMLLTLFTDSGNSPGTSIESWTVPLSPSDTSLTLVTVTSLKDELLAAGHQYWLSMVPTDPVHTGIGWAFGSPGLQLPIAEAMTGVNSAWGPTTLNAASAFSVTGTTVPEPGTFGIGALVFLLSILAGRRARRSASG